MFSRIAFFALPLLAVATSAAVVARNDAPTTACCSSTVPADSVAGAKALGLIGVVLQDLTVAIGLNCSPISVVGVGSGAECNSDPVSCSDGVIGSIGIGCAPITL
ncbi:hypothetical protein BC835DRAFT_1414871 [Cytidiella melzeri]|nr:hypothetical protein BC835DRAFT_1414871 [Cytidiella melzeri]